jgi:hypothetical protein
MEWIIENKSAIATPNIEWDFKIRLCPYQKKVNYFFHFFGEVFSRFLP